MNFLEQKILESGAIKSDGTIKVDNFLNHQIDIDVMRYIAIELKRRFGKKPVTKILTIEASGIALATMLATMYDAPVVYAKKGQIYNGVEDKYVSHAFSAKQCHMNNVFVSKPYINEGDKVLVVDDFLAEGQACLALIDIAHQAGATITGVGVAIEKGYMDGGEKLRNAGFQVESIAIIESVDIEKQAITFKQRT